MTGSEITSQPFHIAELKSERTRVIAVLGVIVALLLLVLIRGVMSLAAGNRGEAWPFALLLAVMAAYEVLWLRLVRQGIASGVEFSWTRWICSIVAETALLTTALFLQIHSFSFGPQRALTSPVVLAYIVFIILSTLHLNPSLSRIAGFFSATGYAAASVYVYVVFPEAVAGERWVVHGTFVSYLGFLVVSGFAAAAVAKEIRQHVIAALSEAEHRARVAQLQRDLGLARSIQQGLLPNEPPVVHGFDIAGWNQPADETGGDYFDWQQLSDGRLAVTVADVTGHGIGSALVMSACRAYARAGLAADTDPQRFLKRLNRLLHEDLPAEKFVTLVTGLLDPSCATMYLISAGHGPLLYYSPAEGRFECFDAQGPPLGLLPQSTYGKAWTLQFRAGDILVLVTDGFIEWTDSTGEDFGVDRLQEVIRMNRDKTSATIISALHSTILSFAGSMPQNDDLTALVVKRV